MRHNARLATAFHEAGHAVQVLRERLKLRSVSIEPTAEFNGVCRFTSPRLVKPDGDIREQAASQRGRIALAGVIAQRRHAPRSVRSYHGSADYHTALELAVRLAGSTRQAEAWCALWAAQVEDGMAARWAAVEAFATLLMTEGTVSGIDAMKVGWRALLRASAA